MNLKFQMPGVIADWDFEQVAEKTQADNAFDDDYVLTGIEHLKLFYATVQADPVNFSYGISAAVDPFWHSHILFTQDYQAFCAAAFPDLGYLHHFPLLDSAATETEAAVSRIYAATRQIVLARFVELPADIDNWWPDESVLNGVKASACTEKDAPPSV